MGNHALSQGLKMTRRAFIIGGTGQIGRAVAARFLADGWQVTLSSRGQRTVPSDLVALGADFVTLDREQPGSIAKALQDGADAVIDTVAYDRYHADQLLEVAGDVGAFVVISSASVYHDEEGRTLDEARESGFPDFPGPISEAQPTVAPGPETYSTRKVALERRLLDGARPVTIIRPCAIHGPYSSHPREWWFVKRMLDGRRVIPLAYRGQSRFHTTAVANIAALVATALGRPKSRILNAADPEALTVEEIGAAIARQMHYEGRIVPLDLGDERGNARVGWSPWSVPAPFLLSTDSALALGYRPVMDYAHAVGLSCDWLRQQDIENWQTAFPVLAAYPIPLFDYVAEDAFLKMLDFESEY
jgi:nucleoside-diphosphate-sugar epimerase